MTLVIVAFVALVLANIAGLIYLSSNLRGIQQENESIYEKEIEIRSEEKDSVITYRDLMDEEEPLDYGQMNY